MLQRDDVRHRGLVGFVSGKNDGAAMFREGNSCRKRMPVPVFGALLRVLEDQVIRRLGGIRDMRGDVRVIVASNRDLEKAVREGQFRRDLYYGLAPAAQWRPCARAEAE